jgi:hypothetical protein
MSAKKWHGRPTLPPLTSGDVKALGDGEVTTVNETGG